MPFIITLWTDDSLSAERRTSGVPLPYGGRDRGKRGRTAIPAGQGGYKCARAERRSVITFFFFYFFFVTDNLKLFTFRLPAAKHSPKEPSADRPNNENELPTIRSSILSFHRNRKRKCKKNRVTVRRDRRYSSGFPCASVFGRPVRTRC